MVLEDTDRNHWLSWEGHSCLREVASVLLGLVLVLKDTSQSRQECLVTGQQGSADKPLVSQTHNLLYIYFCFFHLISESMLFIIYSSYIPSHYLTYVVTRWAHSYWPLPPYMALVNLDFHRMRFSNIDKIYLTNRTHAKYNIPAKSKENTRLAHFGNLP